MWLQKKLWRGLWGSSGSSECWWCIRWVATQLMGLPCQQQTPRTERACSSQRGQENGQHRDLPQLDAHVEREQ